MSIMPYINKEEYAAISKIKSTKNRLIRMKALADAGNIEAALNFGEKLMTGEWDVSRMELDLARRKFLPPAANPIEDPYLLMKRDQVRAIDYYKIVAGHPSCAESKIANDLLVYCQKKSNIGYTKTSVNNSATIKSYEEMDKTATPEITKISPFIAFPLQRPEVLNPKIGMFVRAAQNARDRSIKTIAVAHIVGLIFSGIVLSYDPDLIYPAIAYNAVIFVLYTIPLLLFAYVCKTFGVEKEMPICSCELLREAHEKTLAQLPDECKVGEVNPFDKTPLLIRYIISIKRAIFLSYMFVCCAIVLLINNDVIKLGDFFPSISAQVIIVGLNVFMLISLIIITLDRRSAGYFKDPVDKDCANELDLVPEPEKMSGAA